MPTSAVPALWHGLHILASYYKQLLAIIPLPSTAFLPVQQLFPYPTCYETLLDDKARRAFRYVGHTMENKLVFLTIQEEDNLHICMKFTETYSTEAHQHLASLGCASELCGLQVILGG
ncbi:hypothetical protein JVT61DRAFT_12099 [Boletus reticuloceps]|uniref:Uncharacterized protein n=1 Tax=Boletus reticuloceps TaxID=495285 RepID=A0A8I2YEP8_9AGAM|nr:hypothetical protein JVT61DRAFT_12099 [Boletus reticuloceps]